MAQKGKKWSPAQRAKFKKTVAAKHANKVDNKVTAIPLEAIPARPSKADDAVRAAHKVAKQAKIVGKETLRIELAIELIKLVREILR